MVMTIFDHALREKDIGLKGFDNAITSNEKEVPRQAVEMLLEASCLFAPSKLEQDPLAALEAAAVLSELPRYADAGFVSPEDLSSVFDGAVIALSGEENIEILVPGIARLLAVGLRSGGIRQVSRITAALGALDKWFGTEPVAVMEGIIAVLGSPVAAIVDKPAASDIVISVFQRVAASSSPELAMAFLFTLGNELDTCLGPDSTVSANGQRACAEFVSSEFVPRFYRGFFEKYWSASNPLETCGLLNLTRGLLLRPGLAAAALLAEPHLFKRLTDSKDVDRNPDVMRWRHECCCAAEALLRHGCQELEPYRQSIENWVKQGAFPPKTNQKEAPEVAAEAL